MLDGLQMPTGLRLSSMVAVPALSIPDSNVSVVVAGGNITMQVGWYAVVGWRSVVGSVVGLYEPASGWFFPMRLLNAKDHMHHLNVVVRMCCFAVGERDQSRALCHTLRGHTQSDARQWSGEWCVR